MAKNFKKPAAEGVCYIALLAGDNCFMENIYKFLYGEELVLLWVDNLYILAQLYMIQIVLYNIRDIPSFYLCDLFQ